MRSGGSAEGTLKARVVKILSISDGNGISEHSMRALALPLFL